MSGRLATLVLLGTLAPAAASRAQAPADSAGGFLGAAEALNETIRSGRPTVVVVTSRAVPESLHLRGAIARDLTGSSVGRAAMFAEMPVELYADRVERLGIRQFPTLLAYGRRDGALSRLGQLAAPGDSAQVAAWLGSLGLIGGGAPASSTDPDVEKTGWLHHDRGTLVAVPMTAPVPPPSPSPQQPTPPPPSKPQPTMGVPMQAAPPATVPVAMAMSPVVTQQATPPVVVQQQSPAIYIQPQAPRILLGQMPPPEITIVQSPQGAPTVNYAVVGPQPTAPNLFAMPQPSPSPTPPSYGMPSPQSQASGVPAPSYAMAAPAPAPTPAMAMMATTPVVGMAAPAPQQSLVATTAIALLLENPDVLNALIGAFGRGLSLLGNALEKHGLPRVRVPRPEPTPPASGQLTLVPGTAIPQAATVPVLLGSPPSAAPPPVYAAPPPVYAAPPTPPPAVPSPQSPPPSHGGHHGGGGGLFSRWKH